MPRSPPRSDAAEAYPSLDLDVAVQSPHRIWLHASYSRVGRALPAGSCFVTCRDAGRRAVPTLRVDGLVDAHGFGADVENVFAATQYRPPLDLDATLSMHPIPFRHAP